MFTTPWMVRKNKRWLSNKHPYWLSTLVPTRGGREGGVTWVNFCWVCAAGLSKPRPHYSPYCGDIIDPHLSHFLARRSVVVLLLFVGTIGRLKRWMSLIAWNLSLSWRPCRFVVIMTSYSRREFAFMNKLRPPNQGIARRSHDRRPLLIPAHKVPCPCFMVREFCFAT